MWGVCRSGFFKPKAYNSPTLNFSLSYMASQRDKEETAAAKDLPLDFRTRVADYLEKCAEYIERASTERHVELVKNDEEQLTIVRSVADQHQAIVRRIAEEIKNPRSSIDDYRHFGEIFATTAVERRLTLRDAINGLLFLKTEMLQELAGQGFLEEMDGIELKGLMDFIGTRIDVLFAEVAISYHRNFTERIKTELAFREKKNHQKDLFIRIASHEIRNPLASALLLCELPTHESDAKSVQTDELDERLAEIHTDLLSINRHLTQLLDMSLLDDEKLTLKNERVEVNVLLERIKLAFERTRSERVVTLTTSTALDIETDPDRIEQIITNLLQNAAKYSSEGTPIELTLTHNASEAIIAVTDHGSGIKKEDLEQIFNPYARLEKDKDKAEGLGLGLYICRTLATALGGTLTVVSSVGSGSTFTLTLPLNRNG